MSVTRSTMSLRHLVLLTSALMLNLSAWAQDPVTRSVQASGRASAQAAGSAALGVSAVGNTTLAVSTVPLAVGGSVMTTAGQASTATAGASLQGAAPIGTPLPVTEEIITSVPPAVALRQPTTVQPTAR